MPSKVYSVRLTPDQEQSLRERHGTVGAGLSAAVDAYLAGRPAEPPDNPAGGLGLPVQAGQQGRKPRAPRQDAERTTPAPPIPVTVERPQDSPAVAAARAFLGDVASRNHHDLCERCRRIGRPSCGACRSKQMR